MVLVQLNAFKTFTGCDDDTLANTLLEVAKNSILAETNRKEMILQLETAQLELAMVMYNRLGTEGEASRSEGGISISYAEMPSRVQNAINAYRLVRIGGHAFEKKSTESVPAEKVSE